MLPGRRVISKGEEVSGAGKAGRRKVLNTGVKVAIVVLVGGVLYRQIMGNDVEGLYRAFTSQLRTASNFWIWLVVFLMPVNWLFETLKWRQFLRGNVALSFGQTFLAVLSGVTVSIFTPNRMGDYLGRVFLVKAADNWKAVMGTLAGNICQMVVLLAAGWIGLIFFADRFLDLTWREYRWFLAAAGSITAVVVVLLFAGGRIAGIINKKITGLRFTFLEKPLQLVSTFSGGRMAGGLVFAGMRYLTYSLQYFFILRFMGVDVAAGPALAGIATIFLIQTSIPLPPVLGLLARGEIALFVWGVFEANELSILAASYGLFIINLAAPALVGMLAIIRVNLLKSLGYEKSIAGEDLADVPAGRL